MSAGGSHVGVAKRTDPLMWRIARSAIPTIISQIEELELSRTRLFSNSFEASSVRKLMNVDENLFVADHMPGGSRVVDEQMAMRLS